MIRLIYKLSVIIGGSTKISITLGGLTWIVAVRGEETCDLWDRWIRSTPSNSIREKYFPDVKMEKNLIDMINEQHWSALPQVNNKLVFKKIKRSVKHKCWNLFFDNWIATTKPVHDLKKSNYPSLIIEKNRFKAEDLLLI